MTGSGHIPLSLESYDAFLRDLKERTRSAQVKAALSVNRELIGLYFEIGRGIVERQEQAGWGSNVLERLSHDLNASFPGVSGFSRRNLYVMRSFYLTYCDEPENVQQAVAQIPWGHNMVLMEKLKEPAERLWYAQQTIENGWSRAVLIHQIETDLYGRQVTAVKTTNFRQTLPPTQSDLAEQAVITSSTS